MENQRIKRLKEREGRKRTFIKNDGRPPRVKAVHKVLMCLLYMRHNTSHEVVGRLLGFSADSSENAFVEVLPILKRLFPNERWEAEKKYSESDEKWNPSKVELVIIDSFETYLPRPSNPARQKRYYSGKKKRHTAKTQILSDQNGEILSVGKSHRGPKSDIKIYKQEGVADSLKEKRKLGDKAYFEKSSEVETPKKKPKGGELSVEDKASNRSLSRVRVRVEHVIRKVKSWRIVRDEYRMPLGLFSSVTSSVVGLLQFASIVG